MRIQSVSGKETKASMKAIDKWKEERNFFKWLEENVEKDLLRRTFTYVAASFGCTDLVQELQTEVDLFSKYKGILQPEDTLLTDVIIRAIAKHITKCFLIDIPMASVDVTSKFHSFFVPCVKDAVKAYIYSSLSEMDLDESSEKQVENS